MAGTYTVIPQETFDELQQDAGVLLKNFDPANPGRPKNEDIVTATTGGFNCSCVPTFSDFFEDVDNAPANTKEGKHLDSWEIKITTTAINTSPEVIKLALGAADITNAELGEVTPRAKVLLTDFQDLWWVGDKANGGLVACHVYDALSTGGFALQTGKNAKGQTPLEFTGHPTTEDLDRVPVKFYSIDPPAQTPSTGA